MATSITIDPFEENALQNALNPTTAPMHMMHHGLGGGTGMGMYNIQSMMQTQLMNRILMGLNFIKTDDPMVNGILNVLVQSLVIGIVTLFMTQITNIGELIKQLIRKTINLFYTISLTRLVNLFNVYILRKKPGEKIARRVSVPLISENKQMNELYAAVWGYLTRSLKHELLHEPHLSFISDQKITYENRLKILNMPDIIRKVLPQQQRKTFVFMGHTIEYSLSTELITVYTDKDRKRENYTITFNTIVDANEQVDVLEEFCKHCLAEYIKNMQAGAWEQQVYTNNNGEWKRAPSNNRRRFETISLREGVREKIEHDIKLFLNSEKWYVERDIPYTIGMLFYGPPGVGKTSMIKALSLEARRDIYYLQLGEIGSDTELIETLKKVPNTEGVLVIEDIDAMTNIVASREEAHAAAAATTAAPAVQTPEQLQLQMLQLQTLQLQAQQQQVQQQQQAQQGRFPDAPPDRRAARGTSTLTLSGLLNALDGLFTCHGRILIMTTNRPEVLDEALIRPGRIDAKYKFDMCDRAQIETMYQMFFGSSADAAQLDALGDIESKRYTPAHVSCVFLRHRNNPEEALLHLDADEYNIRSF